MKKLLVVLSFLLVPAVSHAAVEVRDQIGALSPQALADLVATPTQHRVIANFVHVGSESELDMLVSKCITTPNTICVGVDPALRKTRSHFGVDTGVPSSTFQQVALAGNLDFKSGDWANGIKSIIARANAVSVRSDRPAAVVLQTTKVEQPFPVWPFLVGGGMLLVLVIGVVWWLRRREQAARKVLDDARGEVGEMASRNIEHDRIEEFDRRIRQRHVVGTVTTSPKRVVQPVPPSSTVIVNNPSAGNGDFLTGMMVGEALSYHRTPEPEYRRHRTPTPIPVPVYSSPTDTGYDSGGGGGSSGGFDFGGGGGGFDSGGGGFDGGGGGGAF